MELTEKQREIVLDCFDVASVTYKYTGWKNIANSLIDNGECITPKIGDGNLSLWVGGVGNFIEVETANNFVDCVKYKFDLKEFLKTNFFKEVYDTHLYRQEKIYNKEKERYEDIVELKKYL